MHATNRALESLVHWCYETKDIHPSNHASVDRRPHPPGPAAGVGREADSSLPVLGIAPVGLVVR